MTRIIAITNQKGGVGKSTTTYHLTRAASLAGLRVLVVDADPQANITDALVQWPAESVSLADVLAPESTTGISEVTMETSWPGVQLVPAGGDSLAAVEQLLGAVTAGRESRLRQALAPVTADYDLILIDCNPALGLLTTNALVAAYSALIVTKLDKWSQDGFARLYRSIAQIREYYAPLLSIAGVVGNAYDSRTNQAAYWEDELREQTAKLGIDVLALIPRRQVISDATETGLGLDQMGAEARPLAEQYAALAATLTKEN